MPAITCSSSTSRRTAIADLGLKVAIRGKPHPAAAQASEAPRPPLLFAGTALALSRTIAYYSPVPVAAGCRLHAVRWRDAVDGALDDANLLILPGVVLELGHRQCREACMAPMRACATFWPREAPPSGPAAARTTCRWAGRAGPAPRRPSPLHARIPAERCRRGDAGDAQGAARARLRPPTMEVPYYHGPIYDLVGPGIDVAATFRELTLAGPACHRQSARPRQVSSATWPATRRSCSATEASRPRRVVLAASGDGRSDPQVHRARWIRAALPAHPRLSAPCATTLRHYRICDSPSFRLVQNAIDER